MVDGQRNVGVERLADRLAVVHGFRIGEQLEVLLQPVGNLQQHVGALGRRGASPLARGCMGGVERELDVFRARAGGARVGLAGDRRDHVEVLALHGRHELAVDEVVVGRLEVDLCTGGVGARVLHGLLSPSGKGWKATAQAGCRAVPGCCIARAMPPLLGRECSDLAQEPGQFPAPDCAAERAALSSCH
ncbi:hypothetical protein FQZ97_997660 [compost metagenome]